MKVESVCVEGSAMHLQEIGGRCKAIMMALPYRAVFLLVTGQLSPLIEGGV
jgi:hypothetical protein